MMEESGDLLSMASPAPATTEATPAPSSFAKVGHENDGKSKYGFRDVVGYGKRPVVPHWPNKAKVALNFVINYEEGGERCILHGDDASEHLLSDIPGATPEVGGRNLNMESMYDYGSRVGFWRLHRLFTAKKLPVTVFAVGMALERNIEACGAMKEADWEVSSHGYRWIDHSKIDEKTEREYLAKTIEIHQNLLGKRPFGFYQGKPSENTRRLVIEEGGFLYDSDSYADDLPYWTMDYAEGRPHLIIPYTLTENDMKFTNGGWSADEDFANHLKETLRFLVEEGRAGQPKMMTVGLHCRLSRPGRIAALEKFVDFAKSYGRDVWVCTREQVANHWYENHLPRGVGNPIKPSSFAQGTASSFLGGLGQVGGGYGGGPDPVPAYPTGNTSYGSNSGGYGSNSGGYGSRPSYGSSGGNASSSSFSNPASKFSYLGNLTAPRDSSAEDKSNSIKAAAQVPDGDII
ncbi:unnamed protein product [Cylindrotheca closterium]|uniref:NodB homology domain-containing protein n=1 Tax=Cylindrotheca closterium TaxID=2856 RepID=A0AAD2GDE0_9STRA|nr:unnamed protein product [Cylindrotheca closterium]